MPYFRVTQSVTATVYVTEFVKADSKSAARAGDGEVRGEIGSEVVQILDRGPVVYVRAADDY